MVHTTAVSGDAAQAHDFKPTQRRHWERLLILIGLGLALALIEWAIWQGGDPPTALAILVLLVFIAALWMIARAAFDRRPVVSVSTAGVASRHLKNAVAWREIEDVELRKMHNAAVLAFVLKPGPLRPDRRRWCIGINPARPHISLQSLKPQDQQRAFDLIQTHLNSLRQVRLLEETTSAVDAPRRVDFEHRLAALTPLTWALYVVVGANVLVCLANLATGMSALKPTDVELFAWGAKSTQAVVHDREYWRLFTAMFLHIGPMHLALNMLGLWEAGRQLCRWFGNALFLLIYGGSGLVGGALSLHFLSQQSVSAGASGAVFGVLGALLAAGCQHPAQLPKMLSRQLLTGQGLFLAYALVQGLDPLGADNATHLGGLVTGALLGWLLPNKIDTPASNGRSRSTALAAVAGCALLITVLVSTAGARAGAAGVDHENAGPAILQDLEHELERTERALQKDLQGTTTGQLTEAALTDAISQRHLPAYRALRTRIGGMLNSLPSTDAPAARGAIFDIQERTTALTDMLEFEVEKARQPRSASEAPEQRAKELAARLARRLQMARESRP